MAQPQPSATPAWPSPTRTAPLFQKEDLLRQMQIIGDILNAGTLLVDVRRTDYEGGTIRGSINLPAQSFPMNMATLYRLCKGDGVDVISRVVFYCGSSNGRGPRCAGWFSDYIAERAAGEGIPEAPQVFTLAGGIKGWVAGGKEYTAFVDEYVEEYWHQFLNPPQASEQGAAHSSGGQQPDKKELGDA